MEKNYSNTKCDFTNPKLAPSTILFSFGYSLMLGFLAMLTIIFISLVTSSPTLGGVASLVGFYFYYEYLFSYVIRRYEKQCSEDKNKKN
jgi:hypothetical protein